MTEHEANIGNARYTVRREFSGKKELTALLVERLLRQQLPAPGFDSEPIRKV